MIKDEVREAKDALSKVLDVAFDASLDTWEKMAPGITAAMLAINECKDITAMSDADRNRAIIDILIELIYEKKGLVIEYSDEQPLNTS